MAKQPSRACGQEELTLDISQFQKSYLNKNKYKHIQEAMETLDCKDYRYLPNLFATSATYLKGAYMSL